MAKLVDLVVEDPRWSKLELDNLAQAACSASLSNLKLDPKLFEISLLACDDTRIADLNTNFRGKFTATNVLSWPSQRLTPRISGAVPKLPERDSLRTCSLGDIAIAFDTCVKEAHQAGKPQDQHVCHLLVHATLHLLGYDHIVTADADLMEDLERKVLASMGQPDPYEDN